MTQIKPRLFPGLAGAALFCFSVAGCTEADCLETKKCVETPKSTGGTGNASGGAAATGSAATIGGTAIGPSPAPDDGGSGGAQPTSEAGSGGEAGGTSTEPCADEGARQCAAAAETTVLECSGGFWVLAETCARGELCDTAKAACAPIAAGCERVAPGSSFCEGNELVVCGPDLVTVRRQTCDGRCASGACVSADCGDGVVNADEECDDGNSSDEDACTTQCTEAACGDGFVYPVAEECDDGDSDDEDDCTSACKQARCGDGFVQEGLEECDDGDHDDNDACLASCKEATCGDGLVQADVEECDDGDDDEQDDCTTACRLATCGDKQVHIGVEECDDGNAESGDGCSPDCQAEPTKLALGNGHSCALLGDGRVKCWGNNSLGQVGDFLDVYIGDESGEVASSPAVLEGASDVVTGGAHTCAIQDGAVFCWGDNTYEQLGPQATSLSASSTPIAVDVGGVAKQICAVDDYSGVLLESGEVKTWGGFGYFSEGPPALLTILFTEAQQPSPAESPAAIACGDNFVCARYTHELHCFGYFGGRGLFPREFTLGGDPTFVDLAVGKQHVCAVLQDGEVSCGGSSSSYGALMHDPPVSYGWPLPTVPLLPSPGGKVAHLAAGGDATCVVFTDGSLKCFGQDVEGSLGRSPAGGAIGDDPNELGTNLSPLDLGTGHKVQSVETSGNHTCALFTNGRVKCWGRNSSGEHGIGSFVSKGGDGQLGSTLPFDEID